MFLHPVYLASLQMLLTIVSGLRETVKRQEELLDDILEGREPSWFRSTAAERIGWKVEIISEAQEALKKYRLPRISVMLMRNDLACWSLITQVPVNPRMRREFDITQTEIDLSDEVVTDHHSDFYGDRFLGSGHWSLWWKNNNHRGRWGHNRGRKSRRYDIDRSTIRRPDLILNYDHHTT